jgi:hypothetical protein
MLLYIISSLKLELQTRITNFWSVMRRPYRIIRNVRVGWNVNNYNLQIEDYWQRRVKIYSWGCVCFNIWNLWSHRGFGVFNRIVYMAASFHVSPDNSSALMKMLKPSRHPHPHTEHTLFLFSCFCYVFLRFSMFAIPLPFWIRCFFALAARSSQMLFPIILHALFFVSAQLETHEL